MGQVEEKVGHLHRLVDTSAQATSVLKFLADVDEYEICGTLNRSNAAAADSDGPEDAAPIAATMLLLSRASL